MSAKSDPKEPEVKKGCEPVVNHGTKYNLVHVMAGYFQTIGYTEIKARLQGFVSPPVLSGTIEDHRPDLTCRQSDRKRTPVILEAVVKEDLEDKTINNRWELMASAARLYEGEFHFAILSNDQALSVEEQLRNKLRRMGLPFKRIWTV